MAPNIIKVGNQMQSFLNVTAKFKNSYLMKNQEKNGGDNDSRRGKPEVYSHVLVARIKDSQIMFSYIVKVNIIEGESTCGMM